MPRIAPPAPAAGRPPARRPAQQPPARPAPASPSPAPDWAGRCPRCGSPFLVAGDGAADPFVISCAGFACPFRVEVGSLASVVALLRALVATLPNPDPTGDPLRDAGGAP
jgi:hypothetical protein